MPGFLHELTKEEAVCLQELSMLVEMPKEGVKNSSMWGVEFSKPSASRDIVLLKFLRATHFDVDAALERVKKTLKWRKEFNIDKIVTGTLPEQYQGHDFLCGYDKQDRPIVVTHWGGMDLDKVFANLELFIRYRIFIQEAAIKKLFPFKKGKPEDICFIWDMDGVPNFPGSSYRSGLAKMQEVFGDHYPEIMGRTLFVNLPSFFAAMWNASSVFMAKRTREKFVNFNNDLTGIFEYLEPQHLPIKLGGLLDPKSYRDQSSEERKRCKGISEYISAGTKATISIAKADKEGRLMVWKARPLYYEVLIPKVEFVRDDTKETIQIPCNHNRKSPTEELVSGQYITPAKGKLRITFSNESSWVSGRQVLASCSVERAPGTGSSPRTTERRDSARSSRSSSRSKSSEKATRSESKKRDSTPPKK